MSLGIKRIRFLYRDHIPFLQNVTLSAAVQQSLESTRFFKVQNISLKKKTQTDLLKNQLMEVCWFTLLKFMF